MQAELLYTDVLPLSPRGDQGPLPPLKVLGEATYGGADGRVLCRNLMRVERRDSGGTTLAQHIQRGDESSGPPLVIPGY